MITSKLSPYHIYRFHVFVHVLLKCVELLTYFILFVHYIEAYLLVGYLVVWLFICLFVHQMPTKEKLCIIGQISWHYTALLCNQKDINRPQRQVYTTPFDVIMTLKVRTFCGHKNSIKTILIYQRRLLCATLLEIHSQDRTQSSATIHTRTHRYLRAEYMDNHKFNLQYCFILKLFCRIHSHLPLLSLTGIFCWFCLLCTCVELPTR